MDRSTDEVPSVHWGRSLKGPRRPSPPERRDLLPNSTLPPSGRSGERGCPWTPKPGPEVRRVQSGTEGEGLRTGARTTRTLHGAGPTRDGPVRGVSDKCEPEEPDLSLDLCGRRRRRRRRDERNAGFRRDDVDSTLGPDRQTSTVDTRGVDTEAPKSMERTLSGVPLRDRSHSTCR